MKRTFIFFSLFLFVTALVAQAPDNLPEAGKKDTTGKKNCQQGAIGDLFRKKDKAPKPPKKFLALVLPNISSNPTNGFLLGVGGSFGWYMGPKETTKVSSAPFTVAITSKSQLITFVKHNIYTSGNKFFLQGDWKYYIYSQPTYGFGTNSPDTINLPSNIGWMGEGSPLDSVIFPMKFNYLKIHEIVNMRIIGELYGGLGYHLDYYYQIKDEDYVPPDSTGQGEKQTPHSYYSKEFDFNPKQYTLSGLSANFVYDTRDNQICPYKGIYANLNYRINPTFLGSSENSSLLFLEFRTYLPLSKNTPRHLIGFWAMAEFTVSGHMPYLTMPYLGDDQRARAGRAYTNGRFRGKNMVYGEVEYRFPIWPCTHIIGGVLFVNAVTTDSPYPEKNIHLFEYIKPGVGIGLRIMVNKYFRTNINLDYAIGVKSKGFYFSGQETF